MKVQKVREHFLSTPHGPFYITKMDWIRCASCRTVATVEINYLKPWHWYECVMCGYIDFWDAQWENARAEMPMT